MLACFQLLSKACGVQPGTGHQMAVSKRTPRLRETVELAASGALGCRQSSALSLRGGTGYKSRSLHHRSLEHLQLRQVLQRYLELLKLPKISLLCACYSQVWALRRLLVCQWVATPLASVLEGPGPKQSTHPALWAKVLRIHTLSRRHFSRRELPQVLSAPTTCSSTMRCDAPKTTHTHHSVILGLQRFPGCQI